MPATLNIRDIGADRKAAIEAEARLRGVSVAEVDLLVTGFRAYSQSRRIGIRGTSAGGMG
jgi:hypothetical protein